MLFLSPLILSLFALRYGQEICVELGNVVLYTVNTPVHGHWPPSDGLDLMGHGSDPAYVVVGEEAVSRIVVAEGQEFVTWVCIWWEYCLVAFPK